MSDTYIKESTYEVMAPVLTAQGMERGDLIGLSSGNAVRAEDESWVDLVTSQANFVKKFLGVSQQRKTAGTARVYGNGSDNTLMVNTTGVYKFSCTSATFAVGDLVGPAKQSGNALESQKVVAVAEERLAIGRVVEAGTSVTTVLVRIFSTLAPLGRFGKDLDVYNNFVTISNGDGSTALSPSSQKLGTSKATASTLLATFSTTADTTVAPSLDFLKSANATVGSNTVVASGEILGEINFFGADGTDFKSPAAQIQAVVDATPGTGDMPGRLSLKTSVDGGETLTEAVRIDNAQRLVRGGVAAQTVGGNVGSTQNWGTTAATSQMVVGCSSVTDGTQAEIAFVKGGNAAVGSFTGVSASEALGAITWYGDNATNYTNAHAQIKAVVDATPGASDAPGRISFLTTPDGSTTLTEAMRIDNAQVVRPLTGLVVTSGTSGNITTTRSLSAADSGCTFSVAKSSAYAITLPAAAAGLRFKFMVLDTGANIVTISDGSAHFKGVVSVNNVNTIMTGTTLSLAASGGVGDWVQIEGIDSSTYLVSGMCVAAGKITMA